MSIRRGIALVALLAGASCGSESGTDSPAEGFPDFVAHQPDAFLADGGQPNAWADYDGDGDPDLFVGFAHGPNRLYRNDAGRFTDVAAAVGLADEMDTRAAAWGDYDGDGDVDLYVGFASAEDPPNRLYRNDGGSFVNVAEALGVDDTGTTRQPAFVDYDGDGDLDLFVAFRYEPNRLYRNDGDAFADVTERSGIGDPRRTVGASWFDMDDDGDLDVFTANQNGDEDGFYRNDGGFFTDVAVELGMSQPGRTEEQGSVGTAVADYDNDGDLDLFVASYGPEVLWENLGTGRGFREAAAGTVLDEERHSVAAAWADADNDGWVDLFVGAFLAGEPELEDRLWRNVRGTFQNATPAAIEAHGATHGVAWADFDGDGDQDLGLANNDPVGTHPLYRNELAAAARARSLDVAVVDGEGHWTRAGAEVTVWPADADAPDGGLRMTRLVDTGSGYSSQSAVPVHFGIPDGWHRVNVRVRWFESGGARERTMSAVDPAEHAGRALEFRTGGGDG